MPTVTFSPSGVSAEIPVGGSLLDAARLARVRLEAPCNGTGTCGKCRVKLDVAGQGRARIVPNRNLPPDLAAEGWALLCSTLALGDLDVTVPGSGERGLRILEDGVRLDLPVQPAITKQFVPERRCTVVRSGDRVLGEEGGDSTTRLYGVAVDIGTTTLVASLLDLGTGARVGSVSALNPQVAHGQDVLSRVQMASQPEGLALLHGDLMAEIDRMIGLLAAEARIPRRRIYEVVAAGNTCMMHLAANVSPEPLGRFPYTPALEGNESRAAAPLGLHIAACGEVFLPPLISGFVGADITAGILATGLAESEGATLFVDIGTNGEMVLARDGRLQATSTAAGPAFEGMNIACGMRAARGAIERVTIEADDIRVATIDGAEAVGICGSGLIDAAAAMVVLGVLDRSGRFTRDCDRLPPLIRARLRPLEGKTVFYLDGEVYLSQRDIRQVQLAKAAVRAGIDTMLARNGLAPIGANVSRETAARPIASWPDLVRPSTTLPQPTAQVVDGRDKPGHDTEAEAVPPTRMLAPMGLAPAALGRVLVAGSFGYHLTTTSLIDIGLFPAELEDRVTYVGNTARTGAEALLINADARAALARTTRAVESIELANDPQFSNVFVAAMAFPAREFALS